MLISDAYREQQQELHENPLYGVAARLYAPMIARLMNAQGVTELLDYGAGKRVLLKKLADNKLVDHQFRYFPYDPAFDNDPPEPREMVACIDVLEHIEPDCIEAVLDDLLRVTKRIGFFTIATGPAEKTLPDGRNAHLIQQPAEWWMPKLMERFELHTFQKRSDGFIVLVTPLQFGGDEWQQH